LNEKGGGIKMEIKSRDVKMHDWFSPLRKIIIFISPLEFIISRPGNFFAVDFCHRRALSSTLKP